MRTCCFCLLTFGLLVPRLCLAQAPADEARREQEMQEDVEVLRRIVTESVQKVYQEADERVTRSCTVCHDVGSAIDFFGIKDFDGRIRLGEHWWHADNLDAIHAHPVGRATRPAIRPAWRGWRTTSPATASSFNWMRPLRWLTAT